MQNQSIGLEFLTQKLLKFVILQKNWHTAFKYVTKNFYTTLKVLVI